MTPGEIQQAIEQMNNLQIPKPSHREGDQSPNEESESDN